MQVGMAFQYTAAVDGHLLPGYYIARRRWIPGAKWHIFEKLRGKEEIAFFAGICPRKTRMFGTKIATWTENQFSEFIFFDKGTNFPDKEHEL